MFFCTKRQFEVLSIQKCINVTSALTLDSLYAELFCFYFRSLFLKSRFRLFHRFFQCSFMQFAILWLVAASVRSFDRRLFLMKIIINRTAVLDRVSFILVVYVQSFLFQNKMSSCSLHQKFDYECTCCERREKALCCCTHRSEQWPFSFLMKRPFCANPKIGQNFRIIETTCVYRSFSFTRNEQHWVRAACACLSLQFAIIAQRNIWNLAQFSSIAQTFGTQYTLKYF